MLRAAFWFYVNTFVHMLICEEKALFTQETSWGQAKKLIESVGNLTEITRKQCQERKGSEDQVLRKMLIGQEHCVRLGTR